MKKTKRNKFPWTKLGCKAKLGIKMIKVAVMGCTGRMGAAITKKILDSSKFEFIGGAVRKESDHIGQDVGHVLNRPHIGILVTDDPEPLMQAADIIIDFSTPESTARLVQMAALLNKPYVTGTTGLGKDLQQDVINASGRIPVVFSPNMSVGMTLMTVLVEKVAEVLDESFDIEILEMHHRYKLDAPSGTAIALGHAAAQGRKRILEDTAVRPRTGQRHPGEIGFAVLRGGAIAGDHTVFYAGDSEMLEISHRAYDRNVFASGALIAAEWLIKQKPGLYNMQDVLGLTGS
jgi:4-hydroxy-tetrahydrodipicolinate reductase